MKTYCINRHKISHDLLEDEVIAIHFDTGVYYSLRDLAARLWGRLAEPVSAARLATWFSAADAGVPARLAVFLDGLVADQLLVVGDQPDTAPPGDGSWGAFQDPVMEKYTDMQDLLLADPVHDVQAGAGWPYLQPD